MQGGFFAIQLPILGAIKSCGAIHMVLSPALIAPSPVDGGFGPLGISRRAHELVSRALCYIRKIKDDILDEKKFTTRNAFTIV